MKKNIIAIMILLLIMSSNSNSKSYAILISGGYGIPDDPDKEFTAYWYDLVLAYEYLINNAGYSHDDVYVFFGNGENWDNTDVNNDRYDLSVRYQGQSEWQDIVDYSNNRTELINAIRSFADNIITDKDNLLIWFPRSHGQSNNIEPCEWNNWATPIYRDVPDIGWYLHENPHYSNEVNIYDVLKFEDEQHNKKYKRIKYLLSMCRSGHAVNCDKTLLNFGDPENEDDLKAIAFSSASWNEQGIRKPFQGPDNEEQHSGFNYAIYGTLTGEDPWGNPLNDFEPDINADGVISMKELYDAIKFKGEGEEYWDDIWWRISWSDQGIDHCEPQIADPCNRAEYLYINENLKLENATLSLMQGENVRKYRVDKISAGNNLVVPDDSNIEFVVDTEVHFKPGFRAVRGCQLHAYIGEIECP
jgi:hypothetical protein